MAALTLYWGLGAALVVFLAILAAYLYMTRNFHYWLRKGVAEVPPTPFFGNFFECCLFRISCPVLLASLYKQGKGLPYLGFYVFDKPALMIRDPDIIKCVMVKDSDHFLDRVSSTHKEDTLGSANLLLLNSPRHKSLRAKITPIFTSRKIKKMFQLMEVIKEKLVTHLDNLGLEGEGRAIEVKSISVKFATDVIFSCAFGLQVDSLNDPDSEFTKCAENIFGFATYKRSAEVAAFFFAPDIVSRLKVNFFSNDATDFMRKIFTDTITLRRKSKTRRNDLIDLLIKLQEFDDQTDDPDSFNLDGDDLVGQAATFFAAGFETSSSTMAWTLYELARQPNVQSKLRTAIMSALEESEGKLTYEMVMNLPYLDMVVSETLRKYPSLPFLDRLATSDYKVHGSNLTIEKGTPVYISLLGLHFDPEYFPEPEKFDPERFSEENKMRISSCVYMPFGNGPRNCIGLRFGLLLSKLGVLKCIQNYEITTCSQTLSPMRYNPKAITILPDGGLFLNIRQITQA